MERISLGSTVCGLAIGTLVLCANFQFGLQTGWVSMMSMPAALLGFAWFKVMRSAFTPQENVYVQSVAVAVGTGPLSFGLVGAIPAIQLLLSEEEGKTNFSWFQLTIWSLGIAYTGIFTAVMLRQIIIRDKQLRFPSGSAAAALIGVLHDKPIAVDGENSNHTLEDLADRADFDNDDNDYEDHDNDHGNGNGNFRGRSVSRARSGSSRPDVSMMLNSRDGKNRTYRKNIMALAIMFVVSSAYTILNKVFGILKDIPILGGPAAAYMWEFEPSPAYIGQGIIMGLPTTASMMLGAILGWAILAPLSDSMGWSSGPVDDWQSGAQGWIMWVSLAIMVADTGVSFVLLSMKAIADLVREVQEARFSPREERYDALRSENQAHATAATDASRHSVDLSDAEESVWDGRNSEAGASSILGPINIETDQDQRRLAWMGLAVSFVLCVGCIKLLFGSVPLIALTIAVATSPLLSLLGVRALGETDLNPVSSIAKLTQFVFGVIMRNKPQAVLLNIVAGAITEAGAQQAGDLMQDYKTGSLLGALMTNQTIGMIVGTTWSVVISGGIYKLYTSRFEIPGKEFRIPTAYIWADCARLMTGEGLPTNAGTYSLILGTVFGVLAIIKHIFKDQPWSQWIPSGVAVGIGMYNVPSFTIARFLGGLVAYIYHKRYSNPADEVYMVILSSGLILGEGLMSVVYLVTTL